MKSSTDPAARLHNIDGIREVRAIRRVSLPRSADEIADAALAQGDIR